MHHALQTAMRHTVLATTMLLFSTCMGQTQQITLDTDTLPRIISSGQQDRFHVQGAVVDLKRGYVYFSFTTQLIKTDLKGNLIGSVDGLTGHLGDLALHPETGYLYGSLEYKIIHICIFPLFTAADGRLFLHICFCVFIFCIYLTAFGLGFRKNVRNNIFPVINDIFIPRSGFLL